MKAWPAIAAAFLFPVCSFAQAAKPCEDLKSEIAKKVEANGVKSYTLDIVPKDQDSSGKVVGTCEGGTKKIVYTRGAGPSDAPAKDSSKQ